MYCCKTNKIISLSLLFFLTFISQASAKNRIHWIKPMPNEYFFATDPDDVYDVYYKVHFTPDEGLEFEIPDKLMNKAKPDSQYNDPKLYWYAPTGDPAKLDIPYMVSDYVLAIREALLSSKKYFDGAAKRANLSLKLYKPDEPLIISFGPMYLSIGEANFPGQNIHFHSSSHAHGSTKISTIAIHEYFHIVQNALWYTNPTDFENFYRNSSALDHRFLDETTAQWATDESIKIKRIRSDQTENQDLVNDYVPLWFNNNNVPLFDRDPYTCIIMKYFTEQVKGGKDESGAEDLLKTLKDIHDMGAVTRSNIFKAISRKLPPEKWPEDENKKWMYFYTAFCASMLVGKAQEANDPSDILGIHDDGYNKERYGLSGNFSSERSDASKWPENVYAEPASTDEDRKKRLKTLTVDEETIQGLTNKAFLFEPVWDRKDVPPRPVYFYAKGGPSSDAFLIRKPTKLTYEWIREFTLLNQKNKNERATFAVVPDYSIDPIPQGIIMGLVSTTDHNAEMSWSYLASPRLIPHPVLNPSPRDTETVKLVGGKASERKKDEPFLNGDTFTIEVWSTGPLHRKRARIDNIPKEDRSIELEVLTKNNEKVPLELKKGEKEEIKVQAAAEEHPGDSTYYVYKFSGRFDPENPHNGECRFKIKLTSPLNLGGEDEEVDESFKFTLNSTRPIVDQVEIFQGQNIVYDSSKNIRKVIDLEGSDANLDIKITFILPMDKSQTSISAGMAKPYDKYKTTALKFIDEKICTARITVPAKDVPELGMVLHLAIAGESKGGSSIDTDIYVEGKQPDTRHFLILGVKDNYLLKLSLFRKTKNDYDKSGPHSRYNGHRSAKWGPIEVILQLVHTVNYAIDGFSRNSRLGLKKYQMKRAMAWEILDNQKTFIKNLDEARKDSPGYRDKKAMAEAMPELERQLQAADAYAEDTLRMLRLLQGVTEYHYASRETTFDGAPLC